MANLSACNKYHGAEDGVGVGGRPAGHHEGDAASALVFNTPELLLDIIRMIADCNCIQFITDISLVSTSFYNATVSERLWREMCYQRWKQKWGFHKRWEKALNDFGTTIEAQSNNTERFWYSRYRSEEEGAKIQHITAEELESLVFDFRFWLGEPIEADDDNFKYQSGLTKSASREFRFLRNASEREARWSGEGPYWNAKGHVIGHPIDESGIEWFLLSQEGRIQWGIVPELWPMGRVRRLENWGWQIDNPNVVLRAIDPSPLQITVDSIGWDGKIVGSSEREPEICTRCGEICIRDCLWIDLLDSLQSIPLGSETMRQGVRVTAELPWEYIFRLELPAD